jgi:hypothetical protein
MMKKFIFLSLLSGMASFASAIEASDIYTRAAATYNLNANTAFKGPGGKVAVGYTTNWLGLNDEVEFEFSYAHLEAQKSFIGDEASEWKQKVDVNRYAFMLNYCVSDVIADSDFFWYGGLGAGVSVIQGTQKATYTDGIITAQVKNVNVNKTAPAAQVFLGLGYNITDSCQIYAGGNVIATQKVTFYNDAVAKASAQQPMTLKPVTFGAEAGIKFVF